MDGRTAASKIAVESGVTMRALAWIRVAAVCSWLVACGKSDSAAAPVARSDLPTVLADKACAALESCCRQAGVSFDVAACRTSGGARLQQELDQQYDGPNVSYDPRAAGDCVAEISAAAWCGQDPDAPPFDACRRAFAGTLPLGAACSRAAECASSAQGQADCDFARGGVCASASTAAASPHGKSGDPCAGTCVGNSCDTLMVPEGSGSTPWCYRDEGLACSSMQVCVPLLAKGAPCSSIDCQAGLYCDFPAGVCVDAKPNGQHCNSPYECQSGFCIGSGTCAASRLSEQTCAGDPFG